MSIRITVIVQSNDRRVAMRFMLACLFLVVATTALPTGEQDEADDMSDRDKRRIGLRIPNIVYLKNSVPPNDLIKRRIGLRIPNIIYLQNQQAKKDEISSDKKKRRIGLRIPNIVYLRNPKMYDDEGKEFSIEADFGGRTSSESSDPCLFSKLDCIRHVLFE